MSERRNRLFLSLWIILAASVIAAAQDECDTATMRRCRREGLASVDNNHSRGDDSDVCQSVRENFSCVLWQTSNCLDKEDQDNNRDTIVRMWRYLQSFCESQGNWYTKSCYQREDVKRCEGLLPPRGYSTDSNACRSYTSFRDCVSPIVLSECASSERALLSTYLMEKGQQRAWNCPRSSSRSYSYPTSAPLAATDIEGDVTYGFCADQSRAALQDCRSQFYSEQREARLRNDSDMRHHKTCCALVEYETCIGRALRDVCSEARSRPEARDLMAEMRQRFPYHSCEDHTEVECSGSPALLLPHLLLGILLLLHILMKKNY